MLGKTSLSTKPRSPASLNARQPDGAHRTERPDHTVLKAFAMLMRVVSHASLPCTAPDSLGTAGSQTTIEPGFLGQPSARSTQQLQIGNRPNRKSVQQLRDDFSFSDTGSNRGIEVRHAQQCFYESISGLIQDNPHSAWTQGLQIEMAKDEIQKSAYLAAFENLKQVWSDFQQRTPEAPALNGGGGGLTERG